MPCPTNTESFTPLKIAWHLSREIKRAMANVSESDRARVGIEVARGLLDRLGELLEVDPSVVPLDPAMVLQSIPPPPAGWQSRPDRATPDPTPRHDAAHERAGRAEPVESSTM